MNSIRCARCGSDLIADSAGNLPAACPRCGHQRTLILESDVPSSDGGKDTSSGAAIQQTMEYSRPGEKPKVQAPPEQGAELYDFLSPPKQPDELGRLGGYRVLRVLGAGGMGVVYEAEDYTLQRRVAIKVMLPALAVSGSARQRFLREARAAAAVEHERIVPIFQVGEEGTIPFIVMPLLKGESLETRLERDGRLSLAETVRIGREIAEALAAAHDRGLIHRDIKPGNVWLDGARGSVKLLDFGLARATESDQPLTQQGSIVGTPAFMAPEQANGDPVDARCDLFSLGCVLYRCCTGALPFQGPSAVSTLVAVMSKEARPPLDIAPHIPPALSSLIMKLLAKNPADRPPSAIAVIELVSAIQVPTESQSSMAPVLYHTQHVEKPASGGGKRRSRTLLFGIAGLLALGCIAALVIPKLVKRSPSAPVGAPAAPVEIGIAYGTEKQRWLQDAVTDFAATPEGKNIRINLIPMGSIEGGQAVSQHEDQRIHVWSPASSLYKPAFEADWQRKHPGQNPIVTSESLCLTPMVFVFWKDRYDAFIAKYKMVSFNTIGEAMQAKGGWGDIAGKPEWGRFRFGQTNPDQSNSGVMALLLTACEVNRERALSVADVGDPAFQTRLAEFKRGLAGTSNSTGNLMKDMVTKGPSAFDAVVVYENLAIDYLKAAQGRWGDLHVAYPRRNIWSENPYYILDVPWSSPEQRKAAQAFLTFVLSEPMQRKAFTHGFRPANVNIPIRDDPESPFVRQKERGLMLDIGQICDPGDPKAMDELLKLWDRSR